MRINESDRTGTALIVSGPSGTGKSTICAKILEAFPSLRFSVSCTTRQPRPGEEHGKNYYFLSQEDFASKIKSSSFLEYATVHGNSYGTLKSEITDHIHNGQDVLLDIDVQGARQVREQASKDPELANAVEFIFIAPPSFQVLEARLRGRQTETEDVIQRRLNNARKELEAWNIYDYLLINDQLDAAVTDMISIINTLKMSARRIKRVPFL